MSVSGIPSTPAGFDVLFPSGTSSGTSSGTPSNGGTSAAAPASGSILPSTIAGSDVLNAPLDTPTVPGFDVLQPASLFPGAAADTSSSSSTGSSTSSTGSTASSTSGSSSTSSTKVNPYQQAYDNIETWSANYLMQSVEGGTSSLPVYAGGESAGSFASLNTLLAQIKPLIAIDNGTSSSNTSSGTSTGSTGSTVDALA